jgi:hypothetical protein
LAFVRCAAIARRPGWKLLRVTDWLCVPTPERPKNLTMDRLPYGPVGFVKVAALSYTIHDPAEVAL